MRRVCTLGCQTGAHYSAVEYTRPKAVIRRTITLASHLGPASCLIWATCEVSFLGSDFKCQWYLSDLSSSTPRYVSIWVNDRQFPSIVTLTLQLAFLLFRWMSAKIIFDQLSFSCQVCRYAASVTRSSLRVPLMACQSPAECIKANRLCMHISARLMPAGHSYRCYIEGGQD